MKFLNLSFHIFEATDFFACCMSKFHIRVSFAKPLLMSFSLMCLAKYTCKDSTGIILYEKILVIFLCSRHQFS
jgi:hypothetical protein